MGDQVTPELAEDGRLPSPALLDGGAPADSQAGGSHGIGHGLAGAEVDAAVGLGDLPPLPGACVPPGVRT